MVGRTAAASAGRLVLGGCCNPVLARPPYIATYFGWAVFDNLELPMRSHNSPNAVHSCDLARAACLARQIQSHALSGTLDPDVIEALAEALAFRLEEGATLLENSGYD